MPMATDAQVSYSWQLVFMGSVSDNPSSADQCSISDCLNLLMQNPWTQRANSTGEMTVNEQAVNPELTNCVSGTTFSRKSPG